MKEQIVVTELENGGFKIAMGKKGFVAEKMKTGYAMITCLFYSLHKRKPSESPLCRYYPDREAAESYAVKALEESRSQEGRFKDSVFESSKTPRGTPLGWRQRK